MILTIGAVREEDIVFSATGHDHSGGVNGENVPEAAVVFSAAGHTHLGGAQGNTLGLDAIKVDEQSAENTGIVTVAASAGAVVSLPSMTVAVGDRIFVYAHVLVVKGATAGDTTIRLIQIAGAAVIAAYNDRTSAFNTRYIPASSSPEFMLSAAFKVTTAGPCTLRMDAVSSGSDSTIAAGDGQLHALVLRGVG